MRKSAAALSRVHISWKHKHGPSPPETVSICLHTLQIIIKRKSSKKKKESNFAKCGLFSELFRFNAWSLLAFASAGLLYWLVGSFSAVCVWTGGQQSRFPVPTGTPPAGLHQSPLSARPHLDRGPAYLCPWVLLIKFFLPRSRVAFSTLPLGQLVTACLHYLLMHSNPPQSTSFHVLLASVLRSTSNLCNWAFTHSDLMWINITGGGNLPRARASAGEQALAFLCWESALGHSFSVSVLSCFLEGVNKYINGYKQAVSPTGYQERENHRSRWEEEESVC